MIDVLVTRIAVCCVLLGQGLLASAEDRSLEFKRPELVAIMWAPEIGVQFREQPSAAWRSDGTFLPKDELKWLYDSRNLIVNQVSIVRSGLSNKELRPLIVVFRVDERAQRPCRLFTSLVIGDVLLAKPDSLLNTRPAAATKDHLFTARISPPPLAEWPEDINLDVWTQMAEPTVLHVLDGARARECTPEKPLQVEAGVTWKIGPSVHNAEDDPEEMFGLLGVDQNVTDAMCDWSAEVSHQNGSRPLVTQARRRAGFAEYGTKLDKRSSIVRVEMVRRRYRIERYEQVPTHPELLSK